MMILKILNPANGLVVEFIIYKNINPTSQVGNLSRQRNIVFQFVILAGCDSK